MLTIRKTDTVLEIGTGSGHQAAVLSSLVKSICTIEIVPEFAQRSSALLTGLGYSNVTVRAANGFLGWPDHAPFDAIIVTAGAARIPVPLLAQLKPCGCLIMPVGQVWGMERLVLV